MMQEHDVVKLKRTIKTVDCEGDEVSVAAGETGTIMLVADDIPECMVEFGHMPTKAFMIMVDKEDLQLIWTPHHPDKRAS